MCAFALLVGRQHQLVTTGQPRLLLCVLHHLLANPLALLLGTSLGAQAGTSVDVSKIYGNIQIVNSFPDYKVKVVNSSADRCGEWQIVTSFPDFKVQMVNSFPDLKVEMGSSSPGVR